MQPLVPRPVDVWLATEPPGTVIVDKPVDQATRLFQNYYATVHGQAMVFGWNGDLFPPPELEARTAALKGFPSPESLAFDRFARRTCSSRYRRIADWPALEPGCAVPGRR